MPRRGAEAQLNSLLSTQHAEWVFNILPGRFSRGKDPVPIIQEAKWASGPAWTGTENLAPPGFDPRAVKAVASRCTD